MEDLNFVFVGIACGLSRRSIRATNRRSFDQGHKRINSSALNS